MTEPNEAADQALARAAAAIALGRSAHGLREALAALQLDPSLEAGYGHAVEAQIGLNRPAEALELARTGLAHHPQSAWLNLHACSAARLLGLKHEALAFADEAVRLVPESSYAQSNRACALADLGRHAEALAAFKSAVELDPANAAHHFCLGTFLLDDAPTEAAASLRKSLAINPMSAEAHNNLGVALLQLERPRDAALAFKTAVRLDPTLQVTRGNVHDSVSGLLEKPVAIRTVAIGILGMVLLVRVFGVEHLPVLGMFAVPAIFLFIALRKKRMRSDLDPDLLALYDQIDADLKARQR